MNLRYAARRLLAVPPTFVLISLVVFSLISLAPGQGHRTAEADAHDARSRTATRAFRAQFGLDRPALLNTRYWIPRARVETWLRDLQGDEPRPRLLARRALDELGSEVLVHLAPLLEHPELGGTAQAEFCRQGDLTPCPTPDTLRTLPAAQLKTPARALMDCLGHTRLAVWWSHLLVGDLGRSILDRRPVRDAILQRLPYTLLLTGTSLSLAILLSLPAGLHSALYPGSRADRVATAVFALVFALPGFFLGTVLLEVFSQGTPWQWFPTGGLQTRDLERSTVLTRLLDGAWHLILPVGTYAIGGIAALSRYVRAGAIEVTHADFVRTLRALGLPESQIRRDHIARNGLLPLLTVLGGLLPALFGGSVVIEIIFNLPGMGRYLFDAIGMRDHNAVMAVLLTSALLTQLGILASDLATAAADPRIRHD